jgi:glycosyltransferase involved in cell wall biosynthesis
MSESTSCASPSPLSSPTLRKKQILIFAAVRDPNMLNQGFYRAEHDGLIRQCPNVEVITTNRLYDVAHLKFDGLVCYFYSYSAIALAIAWFRKIPAVATGGGEQVFRHMAPNFYTFTIRIILFVICSIFSKRILATSTSDFKRFQKLSIFSRYPVKLSYHGIKSADKIDPNIFDCQRDNTSFVTVCGMDTYENIKRKGIFEAIDMIQHVQKFFPNASFTIIGRTTCSHFVKDYARGKLLEGSLRFSGYVSETEKTDLLKSCRFYVQLSHYEGFGIGALEGLAAGCQVIHTNFGGLIDTIKDYGLILTESTPEQFQNVVNAIETPYQVPDRSVFFNHLSQFSERRRACDILSELDVAFSNE